MDSSDEEMFSFQILFDEEEENRKRWRTPKYWVHDINMKRHNYGELHFIAEPVMSILLHSFLI